MHEVWRYSHSPSPLPSRLAFRLPTRLINKVGAPLDLQSLLLGLGIVSSTSNGAQSSSPPCSLKVLSTRKEVCMISAKVQKGKEPEWVKYRKIN